MKILRWNGSSAAWSMPTAAHLIHNGSEEAQGASDAAYRQLHQFLKQPQQ